MRLRDFVPPIAGKVRARISGASQARAFPSFAAALQAAGGAGYNQALIAEVVLQKTIAYRQRLSLAEYPQLTANQARQLLALTLAASEGTLSVLDLGGACGVHYFLAKRLLGNQVKLRWSVIETPAMIDQARSLESDELRFFRDIKSAVEQGPPYTLAFSSGALQYLPSPYDALAELLAVGAANLFLTRVALSDSERIFVHESRLNRHGRGGPLPDVPDIKTCCPLVVSSKQKLEQLLSGKYQIAIAFSETVEAYRFGDCSINQYGYYRRLRQ